ncbi:MAG: DUF3501 family protein [Polyangiaceae bacterium]|nr:DUF3501 family protein [Polyangiaceae bacterium]
MRPIERTEVMPIGEYELIRPHFRARVIEEKKQRRFALGPHMSGVFENRDSVLLQIQEMLRTERITQDAAILHEIATYNELVPGTDEVSMTCFVEISDQALREKTLAELAGLERAFAVEINGERFEAKNTREEDIVPERTTAVHYLRAKVSKEAGDAVRDKKAKVAVVVNHPKYEARAELSSAALAALASDFATS